MAVILPEEDQKIRIENCNGEENFMNTEPLVEFNTIAHEKSVTESRNWCAAIIPIGKLEDTKDEKLIKPDNWCGTEVSTDIVENSILEKEEEKFSSKSNDLQMTKPRDWCPTQVTLLKEEQPLPIYTAEPVIMEDVSDQFDVVYEKSIELDKGDHIENMSPLILNEKDPHSIVQKSNEEIFVTSETFDQSDSISSIDDFPKVYNVQLGKVMTNDIAPRKVYNYTDIDTEYNSIILEENKFESIDKRKEALLPVNNIKSWKSTSDVYWEKDKSNGTESKIEDLELPSVKDLARKFFVKATVSQPSVKPKRRISKELLENEIISKTFSASHSSLKQPQYMHSLTARSISKEFRDELKLSMPAHTNTHPGGSKYIAGGAEDPLKEGRPDSPVPEPGSLRNKLEFFEKLNKNT